ncbi:MAG: hypothetical protein HW380_2076 [Magnetococcales bacterium]|nr:hypothetical protein [Magnetococcales bacterium]HIJ82576.1 hypothetical protein [Magnetococcales bacterium]
MENNTVSNTVSNPFNSVQLAANTISTGQGPARTAKPQEASTTRMPVDDVDLGGLESISQAFKLLGRTEPLPVPEPVYRAIQQLARDVLEGLPDGTVSIH